MSYRVAKILIGICVFLIILMSTLIYITRFYSPSKILISSNVENLTLKLKKYESIDNLISSWGIYTKKIKLSNHAPNPIHVNTIHIILTPNVQQYDTYLGLDKKTVIQSSGHSFKNGQLTIFVYLDRQEVLSRNESEIAQWILHAVLLRIYSISQNEDIDQNSFSKKMWQYVENADQIIDVKKS